MKHWWAWIKDFFETFGKCDICGKHETTYSDGVGIAWCVVCEDMMRLDRKLKELTK